MNFSWWKLVASSELLSGASHQTLDATIKLKFRDGQSWTIQLREISGIQKSVTFEVIVCEPGMLLFFLCPCTYHYSIIDVFFLLTIPQRPLSLP